MISLRLRFRGLLPTKPRVRGPVGARIWERVQFRSRDQPWQEIWKKINQ